MNELVVSGAIGVAVGVAATMFVVKQDHFIINKETWRRTLRDNASLRSKVSELSGFVYPDGDIEVMWDGDTELVFEPIPDEDPITPVKVRPLRVWYPGFYPPQQHRQPKSKA